MQSLGERGCDDAGSKLPAELKPQISHDSLYMTANRVVLVYSISLIGGQLRLLETMLGQ